MERINVEQALGRRAKAARAIDNLVEIKAVIGTPVFTERPDLEISQFEGADRVMAKIRVAEIRKKITERSIPKLETLQEEINSSLKVTELFDRIPEMELLVADGYLTTEDLEEARDILGRLQGKKEPEAPVAEPVPDAQDLGKPRIQRRKAKEPTEKEPPAPEAEQQNRMVINLDENTVNINGREVPLRGKVTKAALLLLAKRPHKPISSKKIEKAVIKAGSKVSNAPAGNAIRYLRKALEVDPRNPKILLSKGRNKHKMKYFLNADVEIIGGDHVEIRPETSTKADEVKEQVVGKFLTEEELAILACAISAQSSRLETRGIKPMLEGIAEALRNKIKGKMKGVTSEELKVKRLEILNKLKNLIETDEFYKSIDGLSVEAEKFLSYLTEAESQRLQAVLEEMILSPITFEETNRAIRMGKGYLPGGGVHPAQIGEMPAVAEPEFKPQEETSVGDEIQGSGIMDEVMTADEIKEFEAAIAELEEEASEALGTETFEEAVVETPVETKPKLLSIEKRDPNVREIISQIVDEIESKGIKKPLNADQLANNYPVLKMSFLKLVREKRYIKPEKGRDGNHPAYTIKDIAMLVYVYRKNNGFSPREIKELRRLIENEVAKRKQAR